MNIASLLVSCNQSKQHGIAQGSHISQQSQCFIAGYIWREQILHRLHKPVAVGQEELYSLAERITEFLILGGVITADETSLLQQRWAILRLLVVANGNLCNAATKDTQVIPGAFTNRIKAGASHFATLQLPPKPSHRTFCQVSRLFWSDLLLNQVKQILRGEATVSARCSENAY
jgi:hypothetical protein